MNKPRQPADPAPSDSIGDPVDRRLDLLLGELVVPVESGFTEQVMRRVMAREPEVLPSVDWFGESEASRGRLLARPGWLAAGLLAAFLGIAAVLGGLGGGSASASVLAALTDFAGTSLAAGAGLLGASWQGIGGVLAAWLGESIWNLLLFGGVVLGLDVLFFMMIRRRRHSASVTASTRLSDPD